MTSDLQLRLVRVGIVLILLIYILQTLTPLRLVNDGMDYLLQASSAADGNGFWCMAENRCAHPVTRSCFFA